MSGRQFGSYFLCQALRHNIRLAIIFDNLLSASLLVQLLHRALLI